MSVDFNTKTMNIYIYIQKKNITLFFDWHEIVVLSQNGGCYTRREGGEQLIRDCLFLMTEGVVAAVHD